MLLARPTMVTKEEVAEKGGLRPLNNKERKEIANMIGIEENSISKLPLINIVSEEELHVPDFAEILNFIISSAPKPHLKKILEGYFKTLEPNDGVAKGIIEWETEQSAESKTLTVYYMYWI
ncbi:hypothetical protein [Lysinibacillus fusiformis]|uniref:hypothetical protein n=1 Tax=Lysinibacillus fusiformis TaxID=28031 RepID=UPI003D031357